MLRFHAHIAEVAFSRFSVFWSEGQAPQPATFQQPPLGRETQQRQDLDGRQSDIEGNDGGGTEEMAREQSFGGKGPGSRSYW